MYALLMCIYIYIYIIVHWTFWFWDNSAKSTYKTNSVDLNDDLFLRTFYQDFFGFFFYRDSIHRCTYQCFILFRYLTGNPCTDYNGYREYVIGTLPQIDVLDGIDVTSFDKLVAKQQLSNVTPKIIAQQKTYESKCLKVK